MDPDDGCLNHMGDPSENCYVCRSEQVERLEAEIAKLRAVCIKVATWMRDPKLGTWTYTEGGSFYDDLAEMADDLIYAAGGEK